MRKIKITLSGKKYEQKFFEINDNNSGHSSIKMTEVYAKIVDKKKLETVNLVNNMFN